MKTQLAIIVACAALAAGVLTAFSPSDAAPSVASSTPTTSTEDQLRHQLVIERVRHARALARLRRALWRHNGYFTPQMSKAAARVVASRFYGWRGRQYDALVKLWNRESGWRYVAHNSSSGAFGIPQALPGSKMGSVAIDWRSNPVTQIIWGLDYIRGRYGSPVAALAHSYRNGWY